MVAVKGALVTELTANIYGTLMLEEHLCDVILLYCSESNLKTE